MARLLIWSRILEQSSGHFLVVVSSSLEDRGASQSGTDLKTREVASRQQAEGLRDAMLRRVTAEALERGHEIAEIHDMDALPGKDR